jgi:hypothetical protein
MQRGKGRMWEATIMGVLVAPLSQNLAAVAVRP